MSGGIFKSGTRLYNRTRTLFNSYELDILPRPYWAVVATFSQQFCKVNSLNVVMFCHGRKILHFIMLLSFVKKKILKIKKIKKRCFYLET